MKATYKRMLKKMQSHQAVSVKKSSEPWYLYILECVDKSYYTGVAKDLYKRLATHNEGKGARYTKTRLPVRLVYHKICANRSEALIEECAVKALSRQKKMQMILGAIQADTLL